MKLPNQLVFTLVLSVLAFQASPGVAKTVAQKPDPDYQIEVEQNTICSFINANRVNIRKAPNLTSAVIIRLNRGDGVRAVRRQGNWVLIAARDSMKPPTPYSPLNGWVSNQYINGCSEDQFDRWRK
jgi:hypothetical protein